MVIVRTQPLYGPIAALQNMEYVLWHWQNHKNDGRNKVGIMSMSVGIWNLGETSMHTKDSEKALTTIKTRMGQCIRAGLLPIVASGNDGGVSLPDEFLHLIITDCAVKPVSSWPSLFRTTQNWGYLQPALPKIPLPEIVVVGATDNDGKSEFLFSVECSSLLLSNRESHDTS